MDKVELTLYLYLAANTILCVATLWVGIIVNRDRLTPAQLVVVMALLILFGIPMALKMAYERG